MKANELKKKKCYEVTYYVVGSAKNSVNTIFVSAYSIADIKNAINERIKNISLRKDILQKYCTHYIFKSSLIPRLKK